MKRGVAVAALLAVSACGGGPGRPKAPLTGPVVSRVSTATDRSSIAVTVYNNNTGLVREVRNVDLGGGRVSLEFRDVSTEIEPNTVHVKSLADGVFSVLEQNYRYDLLTPEKLLEKSVGKTIRVYRMNKETGKEEAIDAEILSTEDGVPVLRVGTEITYGIPGRFGFSELPANLIAKPSLVWLLESEAAKPQVEVSYLSGGLNWEADYVLSVGEEAGDTGVAKADLIGWVTLTNQTGTSYEHAKLKLVAGDVQRVRPPADAPVMLDELKSEADDSGGSGFKEEGFFEYHLYSLQRPTDLLASETKQVTLLEGHGLDVKRRLVFVGNTSYFRGQYGQIATNQKVGVFLELQNSEANHMGMPLPKGTIRVYKADKGGMKQFIGEDRIDHTPRDEKITVKMGESFDIVGDRKQTDYDVLDTCTTETAWEISLRNHKDKPDEVIVREPVGSDWTLVQSSQTSTKEDAHTLAFLAKIPARGQTKITYRIRVKWC